MTIQFPELTPWQQDIYDAMEDSRGTGKVFIVKAKRQVGKSIIAAIECIKFAIEQRCTSIIVEPTLSQCRRVYKDIQNWLENSNLISHFNNGIFEIKFFNGSEIIFKSAEQRDRLRGYTVTGLLVIDEAAFIPDDIIDIVFPWVDANNAPTLLISTPLFKDGRYYNLYETGLSDFTGKSQSFDWASYDTSRFLPPDKLEYYRKTVSPLKFKSEYLGEFISDGSYVFKNILNAIYTPTDLPVYCGIDWGSGNNGDYTAVTFLNKDGDMVGLHHFNDKDAVEQVKYIATLLNKTPSLKLVKVELNSIGRVFYDNLKLQVNNKQLVKGFNTTNDSKRDIIETLAAAFERQDIHILNNDELIKELQHYAMEKTPSGKVTYNGISGYHDDCVMSFAIAYNCLSKKAKYTIQFDKNR